MGGMPLDPLSPAARGRPQWWLPVACSLAGWLIVFATVPATLQDFPLDDDWAFSYGAFRFARGEGIHYSGWAAMPQLGQWLWAWPFIKVLGFNHEALRVATIALSFGALAAFGDLLAGSGLPPWRAAFAAATLGLTPLFFLLQGTFMTDVPALSFSLIALAFYERGLAGSGYGVLAIAALAAMFGALTRQHTLAAPAAVGLAWLVRGRKRRAAIVAVAVPLAVGVATHLWFESRPDVIRLQPAPAPVASLISFPFVALHFCGLVCLPVLAFTRAPVSYKAFTLALCGMLTGALLLWCYARSLPYGPLFPYSQNILTPWGALGAQRGTGPTLDTLVAGVRPLVLDPWPHLNPCARLFFTLAGCVGAAGLVARALAQPTALLGLPALFGLIQIPLILMSQIIIDRYFLALLPGALAIAATGTPVYTRRLAGFGLLLASGALSVGLIHDWLSWNGARWKLGRAAVAAGTAPQDIEGGFEWNGWQALEHPPTRAPSAERGFVLDSTAMWFKHVTGRYVLSFSPLPGTLGVKSEPYTLWLSPGERQFYLLRWTGPRR